MNLYDPYINPSLGYFINQLYITEVIYSRHIPNMSTTTVVFGCITIAVTNGMYYGLALSIHPLNRDILTIAGVGNQERDITPIQITSSGTVCMCQVSLKLVENLGDTLCMWIIAGVGNRRGITWYNMTSDPYINVGHTCFINVIFGD